MDTLHIWDSISQELREWNDADGDAISTQIDEPQLGGWVMDKVIHGNGIQLVVERDSRDHLAILITS